MIDLVIFAAPLGLACALMVLSGWRGWSPALWVSVVVGVAFRVVTLLLTLHYSVRPYDFSVDFFVAAQNVLNQRDPVLEAREGGWHFPPMMAYAFAGQAWLGGLIGLDWQVVGRILPIAADLALMLLVGRLATRRPDLRRFQWACNPLAIMVCAVHGQTEPIALAFGAGAFVAARHGGRRRAIVAGALLGLSITTTNWPVLLLPGLLIALPGVRDRIVCTAWAVAVPAGFVVTQPVFLRHSHFHRLPEVVQALLTTKPVVGVWGWTAIVTGGRQIIDPTLGTIGTAVLLIGLTAAVLWWRRADPLTLTLAVLLVFLVLTHRLGAQYLLWPMPFLIAQPTRPAPVAAVAVSLWAGVGYLWYAPMAFLHLWKVPAHLWALSSVVVVLAIAWAIPWRRRRAEPETGPPAGERAAGPDQLLSSAGDPGG